MEGNNLLPDSLAPFLEGGHNAIWVVAAADFQRREYPRRGAWVQQVLRQCRAPEQALDNWMARDIAFAEWVSARVQAHGYALLTVDGAHSIAHNAECVAAHFGLMPNTGESPSHDRQP